MYFSKSKADLIDEIVQLNKELKAKNEDCNAEKEAFALQVSIECGDKEQRRGSEPF